MEIISLEKAIEIMNRKDEHGNPVPFQIKAVRCDLHRNKGGEYLEYAKAVVCSKAERSNDFNIKGFGTNEPRSISPILIIQLNGKEVAL